VTVCTASEIFCVVVSIMPWQASLHMIHRVFNRTHPVFKCCRDSHQMRVCVCSCTRCYFPAAACIASVIFCVVVGIMLWRASLHMIHRVINRTLQQRLRTFLGLFFSGEHAQCSFVCPACELVLMSLMCWTTGAQSLGSRMTVFIRQHLSYFATYGRSCMLVNERMS